MTLQARLARVTAFAGFVLVIAGGLVTSTGSGLSVPDWPLSYGTLFPPMVGGIRFEHSHRLIAVVVGLLTLLLTLSVLAKERRPWVRCLSVGTFGAVVLQGLLGGLTVLLQLPAEISIAHACLGQTFFAALCVLAVALSPQWSTVRADLPLKPHPDIFRGALLCTAALYLQLVLGASLRHVGWQPGLVLAHLLTALCVLFFVGRTAGSVLKQYRQVRLLARLASGISWLLIFQLGLGAAALFLGKPVLIATAHVAVGALLLAGSVVLSVSLFHFVVEPSSPSRSNHRPLRIYLELTKPRLTFLAMAAAFLGFLMASANRAGWPVLLALLAGTALIGGGASALNQALEWERDGRMERTRNRPIPSGRLPVEAAVRFGVLISIAGLILLTFGTFPLAGALAALTLASYLFVYTPLKSRSALCTLVGAVPGALPPLIGWAAAAGRLSTEAWLLFSILYLWQLPHFLAIAWTHREDYLRAGFRMLPAMEPDGGLTFRQIVLYCLALIPVSLMPVVFGGAGWIYFFVALISSLLFLGCGLMTARVRSEAWARRLFLASVLYLPIVLTTLTLERIL